MKLSPRFHTLMRVIATLAFLTAAVFAPLSANAQTSELSDMKQIVALTADSIASRLRASGRLHLYLSPSVACDSMAGAICNSDITTLVRETFSTTAIAPVTQAGQRWPTLCDNSDEIHLNVPRMSFDTAEMTATALHGNRTSLLQDAAEHTVLLAKIAGKWNVVAHTIFDTSYSDPSVAQPSHCAWSPEPNSVVSIPDRAAGARAASGAAIAINTEESCPWCTLTSGPLRKLGQPTDMNTPREGALVFPGGRGGAASGVRYFVQSVAPGQLLVYDSTGAQTAVVGAQGRQPGEFQSTDLVAIDAQDSVYVVDNELRRVSVFTPGLQYVRQIPLPWAIDALWVLRDGRLLTVHQPNGYGDPIASHSARGEVIRTFGAPLGANGSPCVDCGLPIVTLAPSGYRLWLAWSNRYQLEEWDLGGRRTALLQKGAGAFVAPPNAAGVRTGNPDALREAPVSRAQGVRRLVAGADGTLWVSYVARDPLLGGSANIVDVLDPVRARLVKTLVGVTLDAVVSDGIRSTRRVNEFGFFELSLEQYELDHRRAGGAPTP